MMGKGFVLLGLFVLLLAVPVEAALFGNYCWSLTNGTSCINGSSGTNTLQDVDVPYSLITGHPALSGYDLNVSGDTGSGLIEDDEVFSVVGGGIVSTTMSGNSLTVSGSAHTVDTNETVRVDELELNVSQVNTTANIESLGFTQGAHTTDTFNTTEEMQDACGLMDGGTETLITVTYNDGTDSIDYVVTSTLSSYTDDLGHTEDNTTWNETRANSLYSTGPHTVATNLSESDVEGYVFDADNTGSLFTSGYLNSSDLVNASVDVCITGGTCLSAALTSYTETDPLWSANESRVTTNEQDIINLETSNTSVNTRVDDLETSNTTTNTRIDTKVEVDTCGPGNSTHVEVVQNTTASGSSCVNVSRQAGGGAAAFDLNVTTDGGSEIVILDSEDLNFVSAGTVTVTSSGNDVTVSGSAHTVDTNETVRVDELELNVSQVNTTANIESLGFTQGPHTVATNLTESDVEGYVFDADNTGSLFTSGYLNSSDLVNASVDVCITGGTCLSAALTSYTETDPLWSANESRVTTNEQDIASMENLSTSDVAGIAPNITLSGGLDVLTLAGQDLTYSISNLVGSIGNFSGENSTIVRAGYDDANCTSTDQVTDVGLTINSSGAFITTQCSAQGSGGGMTGFDWGNETTETTITDGEAIRVLGSEDIFARLIGNNITVDFNGTHTVATNLSESDVEGYVFDADNTGSLFTSGYLNSSDLVNASVDVCITGGTCLSAVAVGAHYDSSDFDTDFSGKSTDDLSQGSSNFYDNQTWNETRANSLYSTGPHTTDTNASTACSGTTTYLDGEGTCDDISGVYEVQLNDEAGLYAVLSDVSDFLQNVVEDTTPQLGGNLDLNQFNLNVDPTPDSDHSWSGLIGTFTAGEALVIGDLVYLNSDGKFWKMDADAASTTRGTAALSTATIGADSTGVFLLRGFIRDDTWAWTVGQDLYADVTPGNPTATAPSATGDIVRIVGQAYSADVVYFNPDNTYIELS